MLTVPPQGVPPLQEEPAGLPLPQAGTVSWGCTTKQLQDSSPPLEGLPLSTVIHKEVSGALLNNVVVSTCQYTVSFFNFTHVYF